MKNEPGETAATFGPPTLFRVAYDGQSVNVQWNLGSGSQDVQQYLITVSAPGAQPFTKIVFFGASTFGTVITGALDTTRTWSVNVCAQATGQPDQCTNPVTLILQLPTILSADYDGTRVSVAWAPVVNSLLASYSLSLYQGGLITSQDIADPTQTQTVFPLVAPLSGAWSLVVYAISNDTIVRSTITPVALNTVLPVLTAERYDGTVIQLAWLPPVNPTVPVTGILLQAVSPDGGTTYTGTAATGAGTGSIAIPYPLDPAKRYDVIVSAQSANNVTASTVAAAINVAQPQLLSASYDGTSLTATWKPIAYPAVPVTGYQIVATPATGAAIVANISGAYASSGSIPAPAFTASAYTLKIIAVSNNSTFKSESTPAPMLTLRPALTAWSLAEDVVTANWTPVTGSATPVAGYRIVVASASGGTVYSQTINNPAAVSGSVVIDPGFIATYPYTVLVQALASATVTTSSAAAALVTAQPFLDQVSYDGKTIEATWVPIMGTQAPQVTKYQLIATSLTGAGTYQSPQYDPGTVKGAITLTGPPLDPAGNWQLVVAALAGTTGTTLSPPVMLLAELPQLLSADFDGTNVAAAWVPVPALFPAGGYVLSVWSHDSQLEGQTTYPNASVDRGTVAIPGAASIPWNAQVCVYRGNVQGCAQALPLQQARTTISSTRYDGAYLHAAWSAVAGATSYDVSILAAGAAVASGSTAGTSISIPAALDPSQTVTVSVRARNAVGAGPAATFGVLTAVPAITQADTTATGVVATLGTGSAAQGFLLEGGAVVAGPIASSASKLTFTYALAPEASYSVVAQLIDGTTQTGPLGTAVPVVSAVPALTSLVVSGTTATIAWTAVADPNVTGYAVTLTPSGETAVTTNTNGTSIALTIDPQKSYTVAVAALANSVTGNSASAALITEAVAVSTASYDGAILSVTWPAAATAGATYLVQVVSGSAVLASVAASGTSAAIPVALSASSSDSVRVLVVSGIATGPAGTSLAILTGYANVTVLATNPSSVVATLDTASSAQGYLYESGRVVAGPVSASSSKVTFDYTAIPATTFTVRAQLVNGTTQTGPLGPAVPGVSATPQFTSLVVSGTTATIAWAPVADPNVTGYAVTLTPSGETPTTASTNGTSIDLTVDPQKSYTVAVAALANIATGNSASTSLVTESVAVATADYDGAILTATWPAAATSGATYLVQVLSGDAVLASAAASSTSAAIPVALSASAGYSVRVLVVSGIATGPAGTAMTVLTGYANVTALATGATSVVATLDTASAAQGYLYESGRAVSGPVVASGSKITFPYTTLPEATYTVRAQLVNGTTQTGPLGAAIPIVSATPQFTSLVVSGTTATIAWTAVADPNVTGYAVTLTPSGETAATTNTNGTSIALTIDPQKSYTVAVAALANSATGNSAGASLVTESVAVQQTSYDGALLAATWPAAATAGATYLVEVTNGSAVIATLPASGTTATLPILLGTGTYAVAVRVVSGIATGPLGASAAILTGVAAISTVTTGTSVVVTLESAVAAQGYLYEGDAVVAGPVTANGTAITFAYAVLPHASYSVRTQLVTGTAATGPLGSPVPIVAAAPQITSMVVTGTTAHVVWTPVADPNVTGYAVTLTPDAGTAATTYTNATSLDLTVETGKSYTISVAAVANIATGAGGGGTLVTSSVAASSAQYDGAVLTVNWTASAIDGATYIVQVTSGGSVLAQVPASGTSAAIPIALGAGGTYAAQVLVVSGAATGPAGTAAAILSASPSITAVTTSATQVVATVDTASGAQGYLYKGDAAVAGPIAASSSKVTFPYAVDPAASYTVRAQLVSGTSTGPLGDAVPVVAATPRLTSIAVSGTTATVQWTPVADPNVTGYAVTLTEGGTPVTTNTNGTSLDLTVDTRKSYTVAVAALANSATGVATAAASLVTSSVAPGSASYDGALLTVSWTASAVGGATYIVQVTSGGSVVATAAASGTSAAIPVVLDSGASYSVQILTVSGIATGPAGTSLALLTAYPAVSAIAASPAGVNVTVDTPAGAQGSLYEGDTQVAGPVAASNSVIALTYALEPQSTYSVRVQKTATGVTGPLTAAAPVISAAPVVIDSGYDGTSVRAHWTAVQQPGVSGYLVTVTDTTTNTPTTFATAATSLSAAMTLALTDDYTLTVQATGDAATGPASAASNPLANSVGYFFPTSTDSQFAYLFRGDIRGPAQNTISLYLPQLFGTPPASVSNDPFVLTKLDTPPIPSLPYQLTLTSSPIDVWSFNTNGIRTSLQQAYVAFLEKVELPANQLLPGAMSLLRQVIAQALPLTFAETLYYAYGFYASSAYVNLQPGMRLRIDFENHQFVNPDPSGLLTGFVGAGTSYLPIGTIPGSTAPSVFDAFLSAMPIPVVAANSGGGAGVIDLTGTRFQMPYLRLFYPPTFPSADSGGATGVGQNAVILGAPTIAVLEQATTRYLANRNFNGVSGIVTATFRGRATLIPEVACFVGGVPVFVSIGTTVRQLTQAYAPLPYGDAATLSGFDYRRSIGNVVTDAAQVSPDYAYGRSNDVHFTFSTLNNYSYSGNLDLFDLPVLGGDRIDFEE